MGRWQGRLAWFLCGAAVLATGTQTVLFASSDAPLLAADSVQRGFPIAAVAVVAWAVVGALILSRYPHHRLGWLLTLCAFGTAVGVAADAYGVRVLRDGDLGPAWAGHLAIWTSLLLNTPFALLLLAMFFLLVPDGRLPSRRWWPALALPAFGLVLWVAGMMSVAPGRLGPDYDITGEVGSVTLVLVLAPQIAVLPALLVAGVALVRRLRAARGEQRQQLRWIATSAVAMVVGTAIIAAAALLYPDPVGQVPWYATIPLVLAFAAVPVCTGIAILRYRLYDIDVIINRAVVLAVVVAFVTVGYVAVVVLLGAALGRRAEGRFWPSLLAIAVVALAFQPVRCRVVRWADRLVYGRQAVPYEALADFSRRIGAAASPGELLPLFAEASARGVGARRARVDVDVPGTSGLSVCWPDGDDGGDGPAAAFAVTDRGERIGVLAVTMPPGRALRREEQRLLEGFAGQAGLALRNVRLETQLRARVADAAAQSSALEASRRRLLGARDAERQRVAATINRSVLARLTPLLPALESGWRVGPQQAADVLDRLDAATGATLDALRQVTRGLFPTVLTRRGLVPALRTHLATIGAVEVLQVQPEVEHSRLPTATEAAAYFCCLAALAELTRATSLRLDLRDGLLVIDVGGPAAEADGAAPAPPPQARYAGPALVDRVEAAGGCIHRDRRPDGTIALYAELPTPAPSPM